jgi:hypothetical protein
MPFKEARKIVDRQTKKEGIEISGKEAKEELKKTKATLSAYANRTAEFLNKLTYEGHKNDRNNYISAVKTELAKILKDKTATKTELLKFRKSLSAKSERLRRKIIEEQTNHEFGSVEDAFKTVGLKANTRDLAKSYLRIPQRNRIPISTISDNMKELFKVADTGALKKALKKNSAKVHTILNHYVNGNESAAKKTKKELVDHLKILKDCEKIRKETGLSKLKNTDLNNVLTGIVKTGIEKEKAAEFLIKNVAKLKKMDKKSFDSLTKSMDSGSLSRFLLTAVIASNEGKSRRAIDGIKLTLRIEAQSQTRQQKLMDKLNKSQKALHDAVAELMSKQVLRNIPWTSPEAENKPISKESSEMDTKIARLSLDSATHKKDIVLEQAKHALANAYLSKKGMNPYSKSAKTIIDRILKAKSSDDIEAIANTAGLDDPLQLNMLKAAELQVNVSTQEFNVKSWINSNEKIPPTNERLQDIMNKFYETGEMTPSAKGVLARRFDYQATQLLDSIAAQEVTEQDGKIETDSYIEKYKNIKNVPAEKAEEIVMRTTGYFKLVQNLYQSSTKALGHLNSMLMILDESDVQRLNLKDIIKRERKRATYYAGQINKVSKFLGKKEPLKTGNLDTEIDSPVFVPLIKKELQPYLKKMSNEGGKIAEAAGPLQYIGSNINKRMKQYPQMVPHEFNKGLELFDNCISTMQNARNETIKVRDNISKLIDKKPEGMPKAMFLQRKKYLKGVIENINKMLTDAKSPLSKQGIEKVKEARQKLKEERDKYIKHGFYKGIVFAVTMAVAVGAAVFGGWAAGALGAKIFGTASLAGKIGVSTFAMAGASAGGVIGSRVAMSGFQALDMADYGGMERIWNMKQLGKDFLYAFAFSLLAVGAAKTIMGGLTRMAASKSLALRYPGLSRFSQSALMKMGNISKVANPYAWFKGGKTAMSRRILRRFGVQTTEEMGEETIEEAASRVHPVAEFLVSVANSADGVDTKLSMQGIKAADIGVVTEGNDYKYTAKTPQEFVANIDEEFKGMENYSYETTVNPDGSVTLDLTTRDIDPKTGKFKTRRFTTVDIKPATESKNITPDVELSRIQGLKKTGEGKYTVATSQDAFNVFSEFYNRGFLVADEGGGKFKVSKGDTSIEVSVPANIIAAADTAAGKPARAPGDTAAASPRAKGRAPGDTAAASPRAKGRDAVDTAVGKPRKPESKNFTAEDQPILDELGARLESIGLKDMAKVIRDPNRIMMRETEDEIETLKQRQELVERLVGLDNKIKAETDFLRDSGLTKEANELEDYSDPTRYDTLEQRLVTAKKLTRGVEQLFKMGIQLNPDNASEIVGFITGESYEGATFHKLVSEKFKARIENKPASIRMLEKDIDEMLTNTFGKIDNEMKARILDEINQQIMKPEDLAVFEANKENVTPELMDALMVGGETFTSGEQTIRIYKGGDIGAGGMATVNNAWFVQKPSNKLQQGVVKVPHEETKPYFEYETDMADNLSDALKSDTSEASNNVIKPVFASKEIIIYNKITDVKEETRDLQETIDTMSMKEWLSQFAGGVQGLVYLHRNGITHNDFKPANIVAGKNGGVVIDIGSFVSTKDVGSTVVTTEAILDPSQKVAGIMLPDGSTIGVPMTPTFHDQTMLAHSIEKKRPLNLGDKFSVGTSLLVMLREKGYVEHKSRKEHKFELKPGAPEGVVKLYNLAKQLMDCKNHPYEYKKNKPRKGKDPGYISLNDAVAQIKQIASTLPAETNIQAAAIGTEDTTLPPG